MKFEYYVLCFWNAWSMFISPCSFKNKNSKGCQLGLRKKSSEVSDPRRPSLLDPTSWFEFPHWCRESSNNMPFLMPIPYTWSTCHSFGCLGLASPFRKKKSKGVTHHFIGYISTYLHIFTIRCARKECKAFKSIVQQYQQNPQHHGIGKSKKASQVLQ